MFVLLNGPFDNVTMIKLSPIEVRVLQIDNFKIL